MIRPGQHRDAGARARGALDALWKTLMLVNMRIAHGDTDGAQHVANKIPQLRTNVLSASHIPEALLDQWESEWNAWFSKKLAWMGDQPRT